MALSLKDDMSLADFVDDADAGGAARPSRPSDLAPIGGRGGALAPVSGGGRSRGRSTADGPPVMLKPTAPLDSPGGGSKPLGGIRSGRPERPSDRHRHGGGASSGRDRDRDRDVPRNNSGRSLRDLPSVDDASSGSRSRSKSPRPHHGGAASASASRSSKPKELDAKTAKKINMYMAQIINQASTFEQDKKRGISRGAKVRARFNGEAAWFDGEVTAVTTATAGGAAYDITFADGDKERKVPAGRVRLAYKKGDAVEALFGGGPDWFAATVSAVTKEGKYDLKYADGDTEAGIEITRLRLPLEKGAEVRAHKHGSKGSSRHTAYINKRNRDGTYDLRFGDSSRDKGYAVDELSMPVPAHLAKALHKVSSGGSRGGDITQRDLAAALDAAGAYLKTKPLQTIIDAIPGEREGVDAAALLKALGPAEGGGSAGSSSGSSVDDDPPARSKSGRDRGRDKENERSPNRSSGAGRDSPDRRHRSSSEKVTLIAQRLRDAIHTAMTTLRGDGSGKNKLEDLFKVFDAGNKGYISRDDFEVVLKRLKLADEPTREEIDQIIDCFDGNGDGHVDYREFEAFGLYQPETDEIGVLSEKIRRALMRAHTSSEGRPKLRKAFRRYDTKRRGAVSVEDFKKALSDGIGLDLGRQEMKLLLERFDPDRSGSVDYGEFARFVMPTKKLEDLARRMRGISRALSARGIDLKKEFEAYDPDSDGAVPDKTFKKLVKELGMPLTPSEMRQLMYVCEASFEKNHFDYQLMVAMTRDGYVFSREHLDKFSPSDDSDDAGGRKSERSKGSSGRDKGRGRGKGGGRRGDDDLSDAKSGSDSDGGGRGGRAGGGARGASSAAKKGGRGDKRRGDSRSLSRSRSRSRSDSRDRKSPRKGAGSKTPKARGGRRGSRSRSNSHSRSRSRSKGRDAKGRRGRGSRSPSRSRSADRGRGKGKGKGRGRGSRSRSRSVSDGDRHSTIGALAGALRKALRKAAKDIRRRKDLRTDREAFVAVFDEIDADGSGDLSKSEFTDALRRFKVRADKAQVGFLIDCFDMDGQGKIDYKEFEEFVMYDGEGAELGELVGRLRDALIAFAVEAERAAGIEPSDKLDLRAMFSKFDKDGSNTLTEAEFKRALAGNGFRPNRSEFALLMKRFDRSGDGIVNYKEFAKFVDPQRDVRGILRKLRAVRDVLRGARATIRSTFARHDKDGTGEVTPEVFKSTLVGELDCPLNDREVRQLMYHRQPKFEVRDRRGNKYIDYKRFSTWVDDKLHEKADAPLAGRARVDPCNPKSVDDWFTPSDVLADETPDFEIVAREVERFDGDLDPDDFPGWDDAQREAWNAFDSGSTGRMPVSALPKCLLALGFRVGHEEAVRLMKKANDSSDSMGRGAFREAVKAMLVREHGAGMRLTNQLYLRRCLREWDYTLDGCVLLSDLEPALRAAYGDLSAREAARLAAAMPADIEGMVNIDELVLVVMQAAAGAVLPCMRSPSTRVALQKLAMGPVPAVRERLDAMRGLPPTLAASILASTAKHDMQHVGMSLAPTVDTPAVYRKPDTVAGGGAASAVGGRGATAVAAGQSIVTVSAGRLSDTSGVGGDSASGLGLRYADILADIPTALNKTLFGSYNLAPLRPLTPATASTFRAQLSEVALQLKMASGIPSPDDAHRGTITARRVRVALVDVLPPREKGGAKRLRVVSNQHVATVRWQTTQEDNWYFGEKGDDGAPDHSWLVRTDHPRAGNGDLNSLMVLFELTIVVADPKLPPGKTPRSRHKDTTGAPREYCVAWGMHRLWDFARLTRSATTKLDLHGGVVTAEYDVDGKDVLQRRTGWRRISKWGVHQPSLTLRALPVSKLPKSQRLAVPYLPLNIQAPLMDIPLLRLYREALGELMLASPIPVGGDSEWGAHASYSPDLRVFQAVAAVPEAMEALRGAWSRQHFTRVQAADSRFKRGKLAELVLRMWPAFAQSRATPADKLPPRTLEYYSALLTKAPSTVFAPSQEAHDAGLYRPFHTRECVLPVDSWAPHTRLKRG